MTFPALLGKSATELCPECGGSGVDPVVIVIGYEPPHLITKPQPCRACGGVKPRKPGPHERRHLQAGRQQGER